MLYDSTHTLAQFLEGTAARQPAPGGGSVSALAGALAAAIGEMVVNYSIGKKGLEAHQPSLRSAVVELHRARQMMLELMVEDQSGYQALTETRKLPPSSPEYQTQYPAALLAAIRVPQAIAATATAILDLSDRLTDIVNFHLLSDLAVCAELAMATVRCGIYNVRVNLSAVQDRGVHDRINADVEQMLSRATELIRKISPRIWQRHGRGT